MSRKKGIVVDKANFDLIVSLPYSNNVCDMKPFLGHVGCFCSFIKDFSKDAPLSDLLQKDVTFDFTDKCRKAFDELKDALNSAHIIKAPTWDMQSEHMYDASNYTVGAVRGQHMDKKPRTIYYALWTLDATQ